MSRLPAPDPGWEESTEGDLDADLTEEAGSSLEDWNEPMRTPGSGLVRWVSLALVVAILGAMIAGALLR